MAYRFNAGLSNEFVLTQASYFQYVKTFTPSGNPNRQTAKFLVETPYPFNVLPAVQNFITDNTQNYFWMLKKVGSSDTFGFNFELSGTSVIIKFGYGSSFSEIERYDINSLPGSIVYYFTYAKSPNNPYDNHFDFQIWQNKRNFIACESREMNGHFYVYGTTSTTEYDLASFSPFNIDYNWTFTFQPTTICDHADVYTWPTQLIDTSSTPIPFGYSIPDITDPTDLIGADNVQPSPVVPEETPFDPSTPEPYNPVVNDVSDLISPPPTPFIGITNAGFINVYNPAANSLTGLGTILFPNVNISSDVVTALQSLCQVILNANLINYIIDCHVIPCAPTTGSTKEIKVGFRDTGINAPEVTSDYVRMTCGSLSLPEYFSSFADYLGTRSKLFLPFLGFVDMIPEYWQSGTIGVEYTFNIIDGSFMAYVTSVSSKSNLNGSVIAQFSGNACMHFPITGVNYSNMVSGIVGAAASIIKSGGSAASILGGATSALNLFRQGGDIQQSNGYNSTSAMLSIRTPYLLIERTCPSYPSSYAHDAAYPTNISTQLLSVSGYTVIEDIDLSGIPFTSGELDELRQLLADGVYF